MDVALINDDDWHNIPAPVRSTCEGIINFMHNMTTCMVLNHETDHKKALKLQERIYKHEQHTVKTFDKMDAKIDMNQKK